MSVEIMNKLHEVGSTFEQFKKDNDARLKEIEKKGHADPLLTEKVDKTNEAITKLTGELDEVKTAMNRTASAIETKDSEGKDSKEVKSAFLKYLRKGEQKMDEVELKALSVDSNTDGGFLVRPELASRIVEKIFETSPLRQLGSVVTIGTDMLEMLQDLNEVNAGWVSERAARTVTASPALSFARIPTQELYAMPQATQKMLDDSFFDVEAWLAKKISDKFGRVEATGFVNGTGVGQPRGFTTYAAGTTYQTIEQVATASSGNVTADALINTSFKLKAGYMANSTWLMQRATVALVRLLKDSQNRYLWEPSLQLGQPEMLMGRPLYWANDMAAAASNSLSIAFGDFKAGYQIVDRAGIRMLRDPFTSKPNILFYATKRVGGDVVDFDAIKLVKFG